MAHVAAAEQLGRKWSMVGRRARAGARSVSVPFPELAHHHCLWRKALESDSPDLETKAGRYHRARAAFEREHGRIVNEYWCWDVPSAVALTAKHRLAFLRLFWGPQLSFHRTSDWVTRDRPEIAAELHRCDEIAVRAVQVLTGLRQRICLHLVTASASHLLSLVDTRAAHESAASVLDEEKANLDATEDYYRDAANGQAQVFYFAGMAAVAAAVSALALIGYLWLPLWRVENREFYGCLAAGAIGAVISVIQRINSGHFNLQYDVGRPYLLFLGGLRPMIGAGFGLLLYFAVVSGILNVFAIPKPGDGTTARLFALLVLAFLGGFSERWAQDTLTSLAQGSGEQADPAPKAAGAGAEKK